GRGGRGAAAEIRALADACGALLATSAVAHGLFHDDPWALGISGGFSSPLTAELIHGADLVVGWGCALNQWTTRHGKLLGPGARLARVDLETSALGAHRPIDVGVLGDTAATARAVLDELQGRAATGYRSPGLRARIAARARWSSADYTDES